MAESTIKTLPGAVRYLEDLAVGQRFSTDQYALDADQIRTFAAQFDPQPFHLDDAAARDSVFGGLAASGWHTAAITMRLLVTSELRLAWGLIGAGAEVSWPRPTRPDDVLHVDIEVLEIIPSRSRPDRGMVRFRNETRNQRGEVVQLFLGTVMVPRRPAAQAAAGV